MASIPSASFYSVVRPPDLSAIEEPSNRVHGSTIKALFVIAWIFVVDISWDRTNVSVLYILPLLLLAQASDVRHLWRFVGLTVLLTFAAFQVKKMMSPLGPTTSYFHFSLFNRAMVAVMLAVMGWFLRMWVRWREDQADPELSESMRHDDQEISATLAVLCCAGAVGGGGDRHRAPANYNFAILYPIPLFICVWMAQPHAALVDARRAAHFRHASPVVRAAVNRPRRDRVAVAQSAGGRLRPGGRNLYPQFLDRPAIRDAVSLAASCLACSAAIFPSAAPPNRCDRLNLRGSQSLCVDGILANHEKNGVSGGSQSFFRSLRRFSIVAVSTTSQRTAQQVQCGADILVESLVNHGVEVVFAYPGGASMPLHQSLTKYKDRLRTVLPPRARGRVRRSRLRPHHRQAGSVHGHQRPGGHEPGDLHRRRQARQHSTYRHHRPGKDRRHRH